MGPEVIRKAITSDLAACVLQARARVAYPIPQTCYCFPGGFSTLCCMILIAFLAAVALQAGLIAYIERRRGAPKLGWTEEQGERFRDLALKVSALEGTVDALPKKWEDIKRDARQIEERARGAIRRAYSQLEADGEVDLSGLDAQAENLRIPHGNGEAGVPSMPRRVARGPEIAPPAPASPDELLKSLQLRKFGIGG